MMNCRELLPLLETTRRIRLILCLACLGIMLVPGGLQAEGNNIEFLPKQSIRELSKGVYEVVIPKVESERIEYARELPFDRMSFKERNEKYHSIGTAFFLSERELVSAAHVLPLYNFSLLNDYHIRDNEGNVYRVGRVLAYSTKRDMIVFDLETYPEAYSVLQTREDIEIGDTVFSIGNVQGEGISFRAGQVAAFTYEEDYGEWKNIRFTAPASPGNSGGPLVDVEGRVVGVMVQKNDSENHNVAVPISELDNLPEQAAFRIRNLSLSLNDEQNVLTRDWSFEVELPDTTNHVSELARDSLYGFYVELAGDLSEQYRDRFFPRGKRFRAFLREQPYIRRFATLQSDSDFIDWKFVNHAASSVDVQSGQSISIAQSEIAGFHVVAEKPADVTLQDFLNSPKMVMDTILKALPLTRDVANEKIRIVSLGEPETSERWEDEIGRVWDSSLWFIPHVNAFVYTHCLPYPKAAICNFDLKTAADLTYGYFDMTRQDYKEIVVGYEGAVEDWEEYLALDEARLPERLRRVSIRLDGDRLSVDTGEFSFDLENDRFGPESNIHMHMGYSNDALLAEELLLFEIFPVEGVSTNLRVQKHFEPSGYSDSSDRKIWRDVRQHSGKYTGRVINTKDRFSVLKVADDTMRSIESWSGEEIARVFVVGCIHETEYPEIQQECDRFYDSVKFQPVE